MVRELHNPPTWRSRRSMASRCGWMRMGVRRSLTRDSAMSMDSLYSSLASICRRKWVDFLTLQRNSGRWTEVSLLHYIANGNDCVIANTTFNFMPLCGDRTLLKPHIPTIKHRLTCSTVSVAPGWTAHHGSVCQS